MADIQMERMARNREDTETRQSSFRMIKCGKEVKGLAELTEEEKRECEGESVSSYDFLTSGHEDHSSEESSSSSPHYSCWGMEKVEASDVEKVSLAKMRLEIRGLPMSESDLMKERLSKLLLGEDMSGCGNGVSTALAISNAITNLCATLFGQLWRLEPLPPEKKAMWRREMEWLLCVSDHIVDLVPSWQTFPDGTKLEVMTSRPRSDLYINLPALRKLDNMLLETLDSFKDAEFWYVDQGILAMDADGSSSFRQSLHRNEDKWWLPVPQVPYGGLNEDTRKRLQKKRDCTNQILKAAIAINSVTLTEVEVPESYMEALPKNIRAALGDVIYRYITSDHFYPECLLDCLDLSSEHQALDIANRIEASIFMWRPKNDAKPTKRHSRSNSKSSWEMVKELVIDGDKKDILADRAESLLMCLKQQHPGLPQTTLEVSKIQCNKDVGKAILESYSRVLESLAFNIMARIDDILYVDDLSRDSDEFSSNANARVGSTPQKNVSIPFSVPMTGTPYKTGFATPNFSPAHVFSPGKGGRSPFITSGKIPPCAGARGAKKALTDFLSINTSRKISGSSVEEFRSVTSRSVEASPSPSAAEFSRTMNV